jgi:hypothetical protein
LFTATVTGTNNPAQSVTWMTEGGGTGTTISATDLLTVAAGEAATSLIVRATSTVDTSKSGVAAVTVYAGQDQIPTVTAVNVIPGSL